MTDDRKLPDELVERAAKAVHVVRHPGLPYDPICSVCILEASRALEAALSEGGEELMEVTEKNAPVLKSGAYLEPGRYLVIRLERTE